MRLCTAVVLAMLLLLPFTFARGGEIIDPDALLKDLVDDAPVTESKLTDNLTIQTPLSDSLLSPATLSPVSVADKPVPLTPLPEQRPTDLKYPKIVLYSVSWCPHCKAAKEYFTKNNIPFINRDVEVDPEAYQALTKKYKSQGVPVIVIGDDAEVLKGFDEKRFERALQKYKK